VSEPAKIRADGARILVVEHGGDPWPGSFGVVDRTRPEPRPTKSDASASFVLLDPGSTEPPASPDRRSTRVALVRSAEAAAGLRAGGWPGPVVVEVVLDEGATERLAVLRGAGELVGVVVAPDASDLGDVGSSRPREARSEPAPRASADADADADADAETLAATGRSRGRTIGLLTSALLSGVATVRTDDAATARRVRSVVVALTGPERGDARMES
jgi:hypothetical protein